MPERVAIIDLGSNSARLIVMHIYNNGSYNLVYNQKESIRLSEGMSETNTLQQTAINRAITTLKVFTHMCELFQVDKIIAVATAAVRNASNGLEFLRMVHRHTSIPLQVISGNEEARLGYLGVINTLDVNDALIFDLGGGSTELTLVKNRQIVQSASIPLGAVTLTERFGTQNRISEDQLHELSKYIMSHLGEYPWLQNINVPLVGIGGTMRNLAKVDQKMRNYPFAKVHNYKVGPLSFGEIWRSLIEKNADQRKRIPGLSTERADIIVAGGAIIKCLLALTNGTQLVASGCGLREGLFLEHYRQQLQQNPIIDDILMHSTKNMLMFYKGHMKHADHITYLTETMFDGWQALHKLSPRERKLLRVTALLHDIGITINYYDHPRHSAYLIENARIFGLTHREQMLCAVIAGWQNGPATKYMRNRLYNEFLDERDWVTARKLALMLAIAESLDTTQMQLITEIKAHIKDGCAYLEILADDEAPIERKAAEKHRKWFKKEFGLDLVFED